MRHAIRAFVLAAAALAAGCGGGLYVSIGGDGEPPDVSITTGAKSVRAGSSFEVVAAASDADGIEQVWFFRLDDAGWVRLDRCREESRPYACQVFVPDDGRTQVQVRARAFDAWDDEADSNVLTLPVVD